MKTRRQLDNKYREALQEYEVSPREEQWQRFSVALEYAQKNRKRKVFLLIAGILLFSAAGAAWLLMQGEAGKPPVATGVVAGDAGIAAPDAAKEDPSAADGLDAATARSAAGSAGAAEQQPAGHTGAGHAYHAARSHDPGSIGRSYPGSSPVAVRVDPVPASPDPIPANPGSLFSVHPFGIRLQPGTWAATLAGWGMKLTMPLQSHGKSKANKANHGDDEIDRRGWYLTLSGGAGLNVNALSKLENPDQQHRDVQQIFSEMQGHYQSTVFQAGLIYVPKKGPQFSLYGGVHYKQLSGKVDFNYRYQDIPFRDIDGRIIGYVYDPAGTQFSYQGVNRMTILSIPVYMRFPFWSSNRNELFVGAGVQLQLLSGAQGRYFDVNRQEMVSISANAFGRWSVGYGLGLGYNRWLTEKTALYTEFQGAMNRLKLSTETGNLNSRLMGMSFQAGIKLKIKK